MTLSFDILGMAHPNFSHALALSYLSKLKTPFGIGVFSWSTFGTRKLFIERLRDYAKLKNCRLIRVHAYWDDYKAIPPLDEKLCPLPLLRKVARVTQRFAEDFPRIDFYLSHTAEYYSQNKKAIIDRIRIIKDFAPKCYPVNNPSGGGVLAGRGVLEERHHDVVVGVGRGVSLDGKDAKDVKDLGKWIDNNKAATYTMLWIHSFNLREKGKTPPPRPERIVRVSREEMKWITSFKG